MSEILHASAARRAAVHASGLSSPSRGGPDSTLAALRRLGSVQIDTINVVERAHHHIFFTRNPDYLQGHLPALETGPRRAFEYWSHAAAYLPIEEYRYCLPRMSRVRAMGHDWFKADPKAIALARERIKTEGPLRAQDFVQPRAGSRGWWDWKPAKIALEYLFHAGEIMVVTRRAFQKVYDLAERSLPRDMDLGMPDDEDMAARYIDQATSSLGVFAEEDIAYLRKDGLAAIPAELAARLESGSLVEIELAELPSEPRASARRTHYASPETLIQLSSKPQQTEDRIAVLSPFDPLIIDRKRTARLFGRDYQLECYLPEARRVFGYFALPLLFLDQDATLAGLLDAKAERGSSTLVARRLSFDPPLAKEGRRPSPSDMARVLASALREFAVFNGLEKIEVQRFESSDGRLERSLRAAVARLTRQG